jgi:hypothetical protein
MTKDVGWNDFELGDLSFHNHIWFNAIREFLKYKERKGTAGHDIVLNHLIRQGLVDKPETEVTPAYQQMLRYSALLAGRITHQHYLVEKQVCIP